MSWFSVLSIPGLWNGGTPAPLDDNVRLPVSVKGANVISTANSTTTPLAANGTFTGTAWENITGYTSVMVLVNTDSVAATNALKFQFSTDGLNVDRTVPIDVLTGGDFASTGYEGKYFRIQFTAGSSPQTYLRLQTAFSGTAEGPKYSPLIDTLTDSSSALLVRGVFIGKTTGGGGGYVAVKVTPSGALTVDASNSSGLSGTFAQGAAGASQWPTSDTTDIEYTSVATTITASGDTPVYTPAAGKSVRLHWVYALNDPTSASSTKITVKMGANTYYVAWALSKQQRLTGPVNGALIVNLSAAGNVAFTAFLEEV